MTKTTKKSVKNAEKSVKNVKQNAVKQTAKKSVKDAKNDKQNAVKRETLEQRTQSILQQLKLTDTVRVETDADAVKKSDSAMYLHSNCIMLVLCSAERNTAKRVVEIWTHSKRCDVIFNRALLELDTLKAYSKYADDKQTRRALLKIDSDKATVELVNAVIKAL